MVTTMANEVREEELQRLEAFLDDRDFDGPRALTLIGEAGIGKSTLWLRGVEIARDRGSCVLASWPAEAERELAFAGLGDLLEPVLDDVLPRLVPPRRRALQVALLLEEAQDPVAPRAVAVAVRSALELLAEAQHCSSPSTTCSGSIRRRPWRLPSPCGAPARRCASCLPGAPGLSPLQASSQRFRRRPSSAFTAAR